MFECDIAHRRSVVVLTMLYEIRCNPMHLLYGALSEPYVPCAGYLRSMLWPQIGTLVRLLSEVPHRIEEPLSHSQCLYGTILLTLCSMVWDWRVSEARTIHFYRLYLLAPFLSSTDFPLSSFFL